MSRLGARAMPGGSSTDWPAKAPTLRVVHASDREEEDEWHRSVTDPHIASCRLGVEPRAAAALAASGVGARERTVGVAPLWYRTLRTRSADWAPLRRPRAVAGGGCPICENRGCAMLTRCAWGGGDRTLRAVCGEGAGCWLQGAAADGAVGWVGVVVAEECGDAAAAAAAGGAGAATGAAHAEELVDDVGTGVVSGVARVEEPTEPAEGATFRATVDPPCAGLTLIEQAGAVDGTALDTCLVSVGPPAAATPMDALAPWPVGVGAASTGDQVFTGR